jgi:hypothetical protein
LRSWGKQKLILIGIREFGEISSHVASKGGEEISLIGGGPGEAFPIYENSPLLSSGRRKKQKEKKGKKKEMLDPTHYLA